MARSAPVTSSSARSAACCTLANAANSSGESSDAFSTWRLATTMAWPATAESGCRSTHAASFSKTISPAAATSVQKTQRMTKVKLKRMRTIRFGRTNVQVPVVSLGTWGHGGLNVSEGVSVGWSGHDDQAAKDALSTAYRNGITHWDTADAYGNGHAVKLIGEVWGEVRREDIFLASKFGWIKGPSGHWYDAKFMREQCDRSLKLMRTDVIDLYYFHHCDFGPYFDDAL